MVSFSVLPFSASLCLVGFPDLSFCCLRQSPVWVPRLFYWGMCGAVYRVFGPTLETREFLSAGWLGRSTVACISHALALSYFGMVAVAVSSCYCLRGWRLWWSILCVSGSTLWVLATSLCVCLARNSELTPFCVVLRLSCSWTPCMSQWCCSILRQLLSVIPLSLRLRYMVLSFRSIGCAQIKIRTNKWENCDKKKRRKKNKQKKMAHTENNEKKKDNKDVKR